MIETSPLVDTPSPTTIGRAASADTRAVAAALARAFYDDPAARHCLPDDGRRMRRLNGGFALFLRRVYLPQHECYVAESAAGAALWLPPGRWKLGAGDQLRLIPRMARVYGPDLFRMLRVFDYLERRHPHEPHYYLGFLGVEPASQGRGIGSALLRPVLDRCDADGVPAYLEASTPRNRSLYERHGFEVVEAIELPGGGPPMWRMWREGSRR